LVNRVEKFDNQQAAGEQWDDKNFANRLSGKVNADNAANTGLPEKTQSSIVVAVYFMYKYALFYSRKIFKTS